MLAFDIPKLLASRHKALAKALHLYQLGRYQWAIDEFERHPSILASEEGQLLHAHLVSSLRERAAQCRPTLIWQVDPQTWEADWIRELFAGACDAMIVDGNFTVTAESMVVVCNRLTQKNALYFENAFRYGARIMLVHLSDEAFDDDLSAYRWCDLVYRNYWSPLLSQMASIHTFPLGFKRGLAAHIKPGAASSRPHVWGFAGDPNKANRREMISIMQRISPGLIHLTSGFDASDALTTEDYRDLLCISSFIPCPWG